MAAPSQAGSYLVRFAGEQRAFTAGQVIFTAGSPGDVMYVVKEGEVEVPASLAWKRTGILALTLPGSVVYYPLQQA